MFLERGWELTHKTGPAWETRFAPLIAEPLRIKRREQAGRSWYVDETSINVKGRWCSLYRAIDYDGNLIDAQLSEKRDMEAAQQFFRQALAVVGRAPEWLTTDGHVSYPQAVREILGENVQHRTNKYLCRKISTRFVLLLGLPTGLTYPHGEYWRGSNKKKREKLTQLLFCEEREERDGPFRGRLHNRLQLFVVAPGSPEHDVAQWAIRQEECHVLVSWDQVVVL
jgi:DDE domain